MMFFDMQYLIFMIPGLVLSLFATFYVKSTFSKYSKIQSSRGMTGAQAAATMLASVGVSGVKIEETPGFLSDHYDPSSQTLRLSPEVYESSSLSAIGVACHEAGHAIQHAEGMVWLNLRSAMVPAVNLGSNLSYIIILIGYFMHQNKTMILIGAGLFALVVVFALITLPIEWNASSKAKLAMTRAGIVTVAEASDAGRVLNAAFLTYVAAAVTALLTLIDLLLRSGILGGRRD